LLADFGAAHPIGAPPTHFTPSYFVDDGIEGDVAALARSALHMLGDAVGPGPDQLRAVLREFARLGDRPETLIAAVAALAAEPRWPVVSATPRATVAGPPTHPFGPRPPRSNDVVAAPQRRGPRRLAALVAAAVVLIAAMHVVRDRIAPDAAATVEVER
jgi:hypothetical protein